MDVDDDDCDGDDNDAGLPPWKRSIGVCTVDSLPTNAAKV